MKGFLLIDPAKNAVVIPSELWAAFIQSLCKEDRKEIMAAIRLHDTQSELIATLREYLRREE